jgi:hypothetical protein
LRRPRCCGRCLAEDGPFVADCDEVGGDFGAFCFHECDRHVVGGEATFDVGAHIVVFCGLKSIPYGSGRVVFEEYWENPAEGCAAGGNAVAHTAFGKLRFH